MQKLALIAAVIISLGLAAMSIKYTAQVKSNASLKMRVKNDSIAIGNLKVLLKEYSSYDSLHRLNIQKMQKDFIVYRDSFRLIKGGVLYKDRIITIHKKPFKKADTTIIIK